MLAPLTTDGLLASPRRAPKATVRPAEADAAWAGHIAANRQAVISILQSRGGDPARALDALLERSDPDTYRHCRRVAELSELLAERLGMKYSLRRRIGRAAALHDVGKLCLPAYILNRRTPLHWSHWKLLRRIPELSESLARAAGHEALARVLILRVHERVNRTGYPYGLGGRDVPFAAQIIQVADMFDSLNTMLPFRPAYPMNLALEIIDAYANRGAFDERIAHTLSDCVARRGAPGTPGTAVAARPERIDGSPAALCPA